MPTSTRSLWPSTDTGALDPISAMQWRKQRLVETGRPIIDLGIGDPREPTPPFVREALVRAVRPVSHSPRRDGLPELRTAIARWISRRFDVELDPETQILPLLGTKEFAFSLSQTLPGPGGTVMVTSPGYPIPAMGARAAGARVHTLALQEANAYLPDLDRVDRSEWERADLLWLNYPNNPTGALAPRSFLEAAAERCRRSGTVLAADEAYSEFWFGRESPASALQVGDLTGVLVTNTLSKRSCMTGYRSGFVAGDPNLIAPLAQRAFDAGVTPLEPVQQASIAAWNDEAHVANHRALCAAKRRLFQKVLMRRGLRAAGSEGGLYLWVQTPDGYASLDWSLELLDRAGLVVTPGSAFGPEGEGFVRIAMVATLGNCRRAAGKLDEALEETRG